MNKTRTTAVLPGVTGLTGLPDRSVPENCKQSKEKKRKEVIYKILSQCMCLKGISWGHVLQAVKNSSTNSIEYLLCAL